MTAALSATFFWKGHPFLVGIGCSLIPYLSGGAATHKFVPGASAPQLLQRSREGESQTTHQLGLLNCRLWVSACGLEKRCPATNQGTSCDLQAREVPALGPGAPEARSRRKTNQHNWQLFSGTTVPGCVRNGRRHSWASPPAPCPGP